MTEVAFYHLEHLPIERVLPKLLEKTLAAGKRAVVLAGSIERIEAFNGLLWTYDAESWLPHGSAKDGDAADQPVWLTAVDENPNRAEFLFLTDGATSERLSDYRRCFDLFNGHDPAAVSAARERWTIAKAAGHTLTYWQQDPSGRWEKKA